MTITAESISERIILNLNADKSKDYILQRAFYKDRTWQTLTEGGFVVLPELEESTELPDENIDDENNISELNEDNEIEPKTIQAGDFIDSFNLESGLYEYRFIDVEKYEEGKEKGELWTYSKWIKFGMPDAIGYSFNNYHAPEGEWGNVVTPDDCRYTYLWGTDFKATNGVEFTDEQVQYFIAQAVAYLERELNLTIKKRVIKCDARKRGLKKTTKYEEGDYTDEESFYDFAKRKIQRYGMISTNQRPIIEVEKLELVEKGGKRVDLLDSAVIDRKKGVIKFLKRPWITSQKYEGIDKAIGMYGEETFQPHLFYAIDYTAGYENSDEVPMDLREIIAKVAAVSLLNIIGDGLMSGFSSSSLSMDGISESFSSTQSSTSAYFGARIQVYKDDIKKYISDNKYKFNNLPIGCL